MRPWLASAVGYGAAAKAKASLPQFFEIKKHAHNVGLNVQILKQI